MKDKPVIPPNTCPHIDRVIELIDNFVKNMPSSSSWHNDQNLFEKYCSIIKEELEYIRRSNELLRTASKFWHDVAIEKKSKKK